MRTGNLKAIKEIASEVGRSRAWVHSVKTAMEQAGIQWTAGMISVEALLQWVKVNNFRSTRYFRKRETLRGL